jgi:hypothetical protein
LRLLDLFCGGGGAAVGYHRAGFDEIVGVDNNINVSKYYPFEFVHADAMEYAREHAHEFDLIHASPPCQGYSQHTSIKTRAESPRLIAELREILGDNKYVIENVTGAWFDLKNPIVLCGVMFDLPISRHRLFEINPPSLETPEHPPCVGSSTAYANAHGLDPKSVKVGGKGRLAGTVAIWSEVMGINWYMPASMLKEAIPPTYTEWIGRQLVDS